jgi:hypothetical protein
MLGLDGIFGLLKELLSFIPNADQRNQMELKVKDVEAQIAAAQSATNTAEAATGSFFIAGWRPCCAWICTFGFAYTVITPILHLPPVNADVLNQMLWGLLGLGTLRSGEKFIGVATQAIKKLIKK